MLPRTNGDGEKRGFACIFERINCIKQVITIEPLVTCTFMAKMICVPALTNLTFEKACKVNAGFSDSVCEAIVDGTYLKKHFSAENGVVQHHITNMRTWEEPISSIIPVILMIFLGSYSDRHRIRKPILLLPLIGGLVCSVGVTLNVIYLYEWTIEIQALFEKIIPSLFGTDKLFTMIAYAYITDISSTEMRTIRMATIPLIYTICIPTGQSLSSILLQSNGYIPIFAISFTLYSIAFLNGLFLIKEPRNIDKEFEEDKKCLIADIFDVRYVVETLQLLTKNKGLKRYGFYSILIINFIENLVTLGEYNTFFLFAQSAYQWTIIDYNYYTIFWMVINFVGVVIGIPLCTKFFHLSDLTILIISNMDGIVVSVIFILWRSPTGLYVACTCMIAKFPGTPACKSQLTKYVSQNDAAKLFSLATILGAIGSILSGVVYIQGIYEQTRETFPQAFFILSGSLHTLSVLLLIWPIYESLRNNTKPNRTGAEDPAGEEIPVPSNICHV